MPDTLTKFAYQTFQQGKQAFGYTHKTLINRLRDVVSPVERTSDVPAATFALLKQRLDALIEVDWQDAEAGVYPKSLLFDNPWDDFFKYYPMVVLDTPSVWERSKNKQYRDFGANISTESYPSYYLQNFHHQTDGYLSDMSANLYDLQVELLFNGSADPMRRRILAPLKRQLDGHAIPKVLDVACGTGRTLKMMRDALPQVSLYGVDLSPTYLRKANELLSKEIGTLPQLIQANAEALPYLDNYFEATVSVFLFHELPAEVRQTVINECYRVTQPGGVFIICDSIQKLDNPEFAPMMDNFPNIFHEPYYRHYSTDDIAARLESAGFSDVEVSNHFMSKYWVAKKA
ncbi:class I SAM-dependent methyltransferase [Leptolyngbya cf. ectocarpi LEGE 11479]|uniref:Class I SAM-dependent methyltransferase n=1 Tax=Leptolyngbya cf. ectocarpi LEGE 11479 TaxID=1828722 RepID=A0A928ZVX0_LEPEC|nr:class I SAM-dependent methyltransferase [Leptolyngbya ectocarpi]MBE9068462.1 class I SAM-dependent methyltransferase [Leptolyngbya cf. ectocarpi LEGE 11479]